MDLEQQLNALDVDLDRLEAESSIDRCFEVGFFPWDNPKFLVFLHATIQAYLTLRRCRRKFLRGLIYARHVAAMMPASADPDIYRDICAWANLRPTGWEFETAACVWPHRSSQKLFGIGFWQVAAYQAELPMRASLQLAQRRVQQHERWRQEGRPVPERKPATPESVLETIRRIRNRREPWE